MSLLILYFVGAGPADLPVFDLLSIFGKLRAGFGAMGLRPAPPVSSYLDAFELEIETALLPVEYCPVPPCHVKSFE